MRIFANPFDGIHPDFPAPPQGSNLTASFITGSFCTGAAVSGLLGLATIRIFRNPRLVRPVNYAVLGSATIYTSTSFYNRYRLYQNIGESMRSEGKEPPPLFKIDRLAQWDVENSSILGFLAGYTLVAAFRRPMYLRLLVAGLGGYFAGYAHSISYLLSMSGTEREKWKAWSEQRWVALDKHSGAANFMSMSVMQEMMKVPAMEAWAESKKTLIPAHEKVGCDLETWPDSGNSPHVSIKEDGSFVPQTRYNWDPAAHLAVRELEDHVTTLQQTRRDLALESEVLYAWLAQKEKDYYNCASGRTSDDCTEKRRAAETLGAFHNDLWRTVTDYDWMILDARKRIEQFRSRANSSTGQLETAPPALSADALAVEPRETLQLLENVLEEIEKRKEEIDEFRRLSPQMFSAIEALRQEVSPEQLDQRIKDTMRSAELDERVIRKLIEDARARRYQG